MTEQARWDEDRRMAELLLRGPLYRRARRLFVYVSMPWEPDTRKILEAAWAEGKEVYVPLCLSTGEMRAARVDGFDALCPGTLGIPEPREDAPFLPASSLDLALVPCVCAGEGGERLGHGAGYYDRFLKGSGLTTVCLCYGALVRMDIPMEETDVYMDFLLTGAGLIPCR